MMVLTPAAAATGLRCGSCGCSLQDSFLLLADPRCRGHWGHCHAALRHPPVSSCTAYWVPWAAASRAARSPRSRHRQQQKRQPAHIQV